MNDQMASQATPGELKAQKRRCWSPPCKNKAWLIDWTGYHYCLKHWYRTYRWGGGQVGVKAFYFHIKHTNLIL